jgi:hypothetical protein
MKKSNSIVSGITLVMVLTLGSCGNNPKVDNSDQTTTEAASKEHDHHEHEGADHEELENGIQLDQAYDETVEGIHLILTYSAEGKVFEGTVENVSGELQERVRILIHLSDGTELGPATMVELAHGEKRNVMLKSESSSFKSWSAHSETGAGDHGHSHESDHGHDH